jgi:hypothetical protein
MDRIKFNHLQTDVFILSWAKTEYFYWEEKIFLKLACDIWNL